MQIILYAAYRAFDHIQEPEAYALLKLIRAYIECNMYSAFAVHTERTLDDFSAAQRRLGYALEVCHAD